MKDNTEFGYYLVAFIDLLGQTEALKGFTRLPKQDNPDEMSKFVEIVKGTFGLVHGFHESFQNFFRGYVNRDKSFPLTVEQQKLYDQMGSNEIRFQRFSDGLVVFLSLRDSANKGHMRGVSGVFYACAAMFLLWLSKGYPTRTGIDIGIGAEMYESELYGPVVANAYHLESKIAQYPRIVLGDGLISYFNAIKAATDQDVFTKANKLMVNNSEQMIAVDDDGRFFVDYLSDVFRKEFVKSMSAKPVFEAYEYILSQSAKWQAERNSQMAFRYTHLRNYFEARIPNWKT